MRGVGRDPGQRAANSRSAQEGGVWRSRGQGGCGAVRVERPRARVQAALRRLDPRRVCRGSGGWGRGAGQGRGTHRGTALPAALGPRGDAHPLRWLQTPSCALGLGGAGREAGRG